MDYHCQSSKLQCEKMRGYECLSQLSKGKSPLLVLNFHSERNSSLLFSCGKEVAGKEILKWDPSKEVVYD